MIKRWMVPAVLGLALLASQPALAQSDDDDDDESAPYNYALGVGVGLVEVGQAENYLTANLRIRVGRDEEEDRGSVDRSIQGYIEPEIGYWESTDERIEGSDLLVGVNLIGAFPFSVAESFLGVGVGAHFIGGQLLDDGSISDEGETKLGANAQFGIDLRLTRSLSAFGTGRFDLVQGSADSVQSKVYLGLRGRF